MTVKDMSGAERYSWAALIATSIIFFHFQDRMSDGFSIVQHGADDLLGIFLRVIFMTITLHVVIAVIFAAKRGKDAQEDGRLYEKDERDRAIERKGERHGYWFLAAAVNVIIFTLLFQNAYGDNGYNPPVSVMGASNMFFVLLGSLFVSDIIKRITMIIAYRA